MSIAFLFAGQGSQKVGMGKSFADDSLCQESFQIANQALGYDLQKICWEGPEDKLTLSENAQPAILTVAIIAYRIFTQMHKIQPSLMAGHSLGEYSALVASEVLDLADAVKLVHKRGQLMQEAVPAGVGAMAAVLGKSNEEIKLLCSQISSAEKMVSAANFNCNGQVVVSGHKEAVLELLEQVKGKMLQVSAPFHCPLMSPVKEKFAPFLKEVTFKDAKTAIVNNVRGDIQEKADSFQESLLSQIDSAVLWESGIQKMLQKGIKNFLEFGEGKVLTNLLKRIDKEAMFVNVNSLEAINEYRLSYLHSV